MINIRLIGISSTGIHYSGALNVKNHVKIAPFSHSFAALTNCNQFWFITLNLITLCKNLCRLLLGQYPNPVLRD